jgi:hypothetical protein
LYIEQHIDIREAEIGIEYYDFFIEPGKRQREIDRKNAFPHAALAACHGDNPAYIAGAAHDFPDALPPGEFLFSGLECLTAN